MKYRVLITWLMLTLGATSFGQVPIGIKGGLNFNDVVIKNAPFLPINLYRPSIGFHLGVISEFSLTSLLTFNPELIFIQRGANSSKIENGTKTDYKVSLNYIELPLLLSFSPIKKISFEIGPNMGLRISAKGITDSGISDMTDLFSKPFDFGISGGLKINPTTKISIIGRYYYGITSPLKFPETLPTLDPSPSSSNRNLQIGISYMLME